MHTQSKKKRKLTVKEEKNSEIKEELVHTALKNLMGNNLVYCPNYETLSPIDNFYFF